MQCIVQQANQVFLLNREGTHNKQSTHKKEYCMPLIINIIHHLISSICTEYITLHIQEYITSKYKPNQEFNKTNNSTPILDCFIVV